MSIPRSIKIHNTTIKVLQVNSVYRATIKAGIDMTGYSEDLNGFVDENLARIWLKKSLAEEMKKHVLRHELAHFIGWMLGVNFNDQQADSLASMLADIKKGL